MPIKYIYVYLNMSNKQKQEKMVSTELINVAKQEIKNTKNLDSDYLNKFLTEYTQEDKTSAFLNVNIDACQVQAKYELEDEGVLTYDHKTNLHIFK